MGPFAARVSETAPTWGRAVAPFAEWVARTLWSRSTKSPSDLGPATRLTQRRRREAKGSAPALPNNPAPRPQTICRICGTPIAHGKNYCPLCVRTIARENLVEVARSGRVAAQRPQAQARRAETKRRHDLAQRAWLPSSHPACLTEEVYEQKIRPQLAGATYSAIASALGVSEPYAADIRAGRRRPHPRHWQALAELVGRPAGPVK
jgi:uncharacterized Zn finger protein (UPF0148 family)